MGRGGLEPVPPLTGQKAGRPGRGRPSQNIIIIIIIKNLKIVRARAASALAAILRELLFFSA